MAYRIETTKQVDKELAALSKSGNKSLLKKIEDLFYEIAEHPRTGTGQVEQLKQRDVESGGELPSYSGA